MSTHPRRPHDAAAPHSSARTRHSRPSGPPPAPETALPIRGAGDALALVHHTLGFLPEDSLVVMGLHGTRIGAHLRIDLRSGADRPEGFAAWVGEHLAGPDCDPRPDGAVMLLFTSEEPAPPSWDDPTLRPCAALHGSLTELLRQEHGVEVRQTWWVGGGHVRDYDCLDPRCCPYPGEDLRATADSVVHAQMVLQGRALRTPSQTVEDFLASAGDPGRETVDAVVGESLRCAADVATLEGSLQALCDWEDLLQQEESQLLDRAAALEADGIDPSEDRLIDPWTARCREQVALAVASLSTTELPEAVLVLAAEGLEVAAVTVEMMDACRDLASESARGSRDWSELAERWVRRHHLGDDPREDLVAADLQGESQAFLQQVALRYQQVLGGATGRRPRWERIAALESQLRRLQPMMGEEARAASLAMMAWIEWARGRGTLSVAYHARSSAIMPELPSARLVHPGRGLPEICPWAMVRDDSWSSCRLR